MNALRTLDVDRQVAVLFLMLFGALTLASIGVFIYSLRQRDGAQSEAIDRLWRDLRALWIGSVVFWLSWLSGPLGATVLFGVFSFLALREFITLAHTRRSDHRSLLLAFFVVLPLQYVFVGQRSFDLFGVFIPVYVFLAIPALSALAGDPHRFLERTAKIQWGVMVCVFGLSHAPALLLLDFPGYVGRGAFLLFFLVVVTTVAQVTQELASRWLRRRPVARHIDRTFSWRSWLAGALGAAAAGAALFWITPMAPAQAMRWAALVGACGTLGDFVMRALKKDAGVRFWGNHSSLTGAVGLLDRVAALCFAAPVFFHSLRWYASLHR